MTKPRRKPAPFDVQEYLRREQAARDRGSHVTYEYVAGEAYLMAPGVGPRHSVITSNIIHHLRDVTRERGCQIFGDVITRVAEDRYYYPDIVVTCAPLRRNVIVAPCFVVEVTSPTTRTTDLREKPPAYRNTPAILKFLIVEQNRRRVIEYARVAGNEWSRTERGDRETLAIPGIDARLTLDQIYETLEFPKSVRETDEFSVTDYGREWVLVHAESVS